MGTFYWSTFQSLFTFTWVKKFSQYFYFHQSIFKHEYLYFYFSKGCISPSLQQGHRPIWPFDLWLTTLTLRGFPHHRDRSGCSMLALWSSVSSRRRVRAILGHTVSLRITLSWLRHLQHASPPQLGLLRRCSLDVWCFYNQKDSSFSSWNHVVITMCRYCPIRNILNPILSGFNHL